MGDHDAMSIDESFGDDCLVVVYCRCGHPSTAETVEMAREAHAHHHRAPDAREGIAAARAALENGRRPKENG